MGVHKKELTSLVTRVQSVTHPTSKVENKRGNMTRWVSAREVGMTCEDCYYSMTDSDKHDIESWTLCTYNPPTPINDPFADENTRYFRSAFIRVNEWDWCGKWEPKDEALKDWQKSNKEWEEEE